MGTTWRFATKRGAAAFAILLCNGALHAQPVELKTWNIHPPGYPVTQALEFFADAVAISTANRYSVKLHSNGVLGDQPKAVQMMKRGEIDLAEFSLSPLSEAAPGAKVLTLPFLFRDAGHMYRQLDGKLGERFSQTLRHAGYVVLGWYDGGARHFYCANHRVRGASDFTGLKVRVQQSETAIHMVKLLGATPVVMPYRDVLDGLKTGAIDCAENNLPAYESTGHMSVAKFMFLSSHTVTPEALVMSAKAWDRLSEGDRRVFLDAGRRSAERMRELWKTRTEQARQAAGKQGTQFFAMEDYGPIVNRMKPLYEGYFKDPVTRHEMLSILAD
jgi:tripartite ATP-independent transporter DctP family solute receptor